MELPLSPAKWSIPGERSGRAVLPPRSTTARDAASTDALGGARWDDYPVRATVLIIDDHAEFRRSAGALLEAEGFAVVAEAADGEEANAAVERVQPQIVLLDVQLPGADGFTVAERLAAGRDPPVVVLISSR
jgi:PleD family two-component response regulator